MPTKKYPTQKRSPIQRMIGSLLVLGTVLGVQVGAEPMVAGQVRLASGEPVAGAQVRLFDLTDLGRFVGTSTDETGHFALSLQAFSTERGTALPTDFALRAELPPTRSTPPLSYPTNCRRLLTCVWKYSICWVSALPRWWMRNVRRGGTRYNGTLQMRQDERWERGCISTGSAAAVRR